MIDVDLKGKKTLDIGCGEGHCAAICSEYETELSVGYDIKAYDKWSNFEPKSNLKLTTDFEEVKRSGPYSVVILFDVLDHITGQDPASLLAMAKEVLADDGKIYLRTHPFTSRHATHLYHELNKAYVHLVFSQEELESLVPNSKYKESTIRVTRPVATYEGLIKSVDLKIESKRNTTEKVEQFFKIPKISERIIKNTGFQEYPEFQMTLQFIDYVLTKTQ
jgi:cyclopropane fatty-acyl-phospholipid synthase-like methyltransferase